MLLQGMGGIFFYSPASSVGVLGWGWVIQRVWGAIQRTPCVIKCAKKQHKYALPVLQQNPEMSLFLVCWYREGFPDPSDPLEL